MVIYEKIVKTRLETFSVKFEKSNFQFISYAVNIILI